MRRSRPLPPVWDARSLFESLEPAVVVPPWLMELVDAKLAEVQSWRSSGQGYAVKNRPQPTPRDGRVGEYPGSHVPGAGPDRDNQAHLRWALMFVSTLYALRVRYTTVAALTRGQDASQARRMDDETLKDLLTGARYGLAETRVRATWALYRTILTHGVSLGLFALWLDNDGTWTPHWPLSTHWGFDDEGFVTARPLAPPTRGRRPVPVSTPPT